MNKTTEKPPILCIEQYTREEKKENLVYVSRLSDLIDQFDSIKNPHGHSFVMLMLVSEGSGIHKIDFEEYEVKPNQMFFLSPGQIHSWSLSKETEGAVLFFESQFFSSRFGNLLYQYPFLFSNINPPLLELTEPALIKNLFEFACKEYQKTSTNLEVMLSIIHLLLEKSNVYYHENHNITTNKTSDFVTKFDSLLSQYFKSYKEVKYYADLLSVSPNYLNSVLKTKTGLNASSLIANKLIIKSKRLLVNSPLSIKEIAFEIGFESDSYFNRFFKKKTNQTPADFRANN
jgi:AraC family transcriptional regulator, transcriptional activator of pobA